MQTPRDSEAHSEVTSLQVTDRNAGPQRSSLHAATASGKVTQKSVAGGQIWEAEGGGPEGDSQERPAPSAPTGRWWPVQLPPAPEKAGASGGRAARATSDLQPQGEAVWGKCCLRSAVGGQEVGTPSGTATGRLARRGRPLAPPPARRAAGLGRPAAALKRPPAPWLARPPAKAPHLLWCPSP